MPELTQEQARTLADGFLDASKAVGDFRFAHFDTISEVDQRELRRLQHALTQQAIDLTADAIRITLADVQPALERIGAVTKQVKHAVTNLKQVHKVIGIASSFLGLGAAILTGNPSAIVTAIGNTVSLVEEGAEES